MLTHRDDFFDGAPTAASKDGIGLMAEPFKFGESPRQASAALGSDCSHVWHELFPPFYISSLHGASPNADNVPQVLALCSIHSPARNDPRWSPHMRRMSER
jgi:hypothetical protein